MAETDAYLRGRRDGMLSDEQVGRYREDGYLVVHDLLTAAEVDAFIEGEKGPKRPEVQALGLRKHTADARWRGIAAHPKVVGMVRQLAEGEPRVVQTMYMAKAPDGGTGIALHQDTHYIRNEPNTLMACWIAFSDTDRSNGGLCVVPGSHREPLQPTVPPANPSEHARWEKDYEIRDRDGRTWSEPMHSHEVAGLDPSRIRYLTVPKGSAVFFTSMTIHGSFANRSGHRPRLAFATHYVREGTWVYRTDIQDTMTVADKHGS